MIDQKTYVPLVSVSRNLSCGVAWLRSLLHQDPFFFTAQVLVLGIIVAMTRAFALVSLLEAILWALCLFYKPLRHGIKESLKDRRIALVMLFWLWVGVAMLWGDAGLDDRISEWWSWRKLALVPICFVLFQSMQSKAVVFATLVAICACYMTLSWLGFFGLITLDRGPDVLLENYTTQSILFAAAALSCVLFLRTKVSKLLAAFLIILLFGFLSNILIILPGRSGYVFLVVMVVYLSSRYFKSNAILVVPAVFLFAVVFMSIFDVPRARVMQVVDEAATSHLENAPYSSTGIRLVMWDTALKMIAERPLLGTGSGSFKNGYAEIVSGYGGWKGIPAGDPHNQFLHIAAEQGLIGLLLFLVTLVGLLSNNSSGWQDARIQASAILYGIIATSMFNGHFNSFVEGRFVWIVLAVTISGSADPLGKIPRMFKGRVGMDNS